MMRRYQDALAIVQGACNPSGIAHALVNACQECIEDGHIEQAEDPAIRLIVYQLAWLCRTSNIDDSIELFSSLENQCKAKVETTKG